jgi:hypothetical protein
MANHACRGGGRSDGSVRYTRWCLAPATPPTLSTTRHGRVGVARDGVSFGICKAPNTRSVPSPQHQVRLGSRPDAGSKPTQHPVRGHGGLRGWCTASRGTGDRVTNRSERCSAPPPRPCVGNLSRSRGRGSFGGAFGSGRRGVRCSESCRWLRTSFATQPTPIGLRSTTEGRGPETTGRVRFARPSVASPYDVRQHRPLPPSIRRCASPLCPHAISCVGRGKGGCA